MCKEPNRLASGLTKKLSSFVWIIGFGFVFLTSCSSLLNAQEVSLRKLEDEERYEEMIPLLTKAIEESPKESMNFYRRGRAYFCLGEFQKSVDDFNKHVELSPQLESRQWERGIALYYADKFKEGAAQFELYQTYHDNDVENSAWRFLCEAKVSSIDKARETLLPIRNDRRVPMMEIYQMFQGKLSTDEVLKAAEKEASSDLEKRWQKFYAHLYVGLYLDAQGEPEEKVLPHLNRAQELKVPHYMWNVADVDVKRRSKDE